MARRSTPEALAPVLVAARHTLGHSQASFGGLLGCSRRTVWRWETGVVRPTEAQLTVLARALFEEDEDLAARVAAAASESLEGLGLKPAPPLERPASPPERPAPPASVLVSAVVLSAAEALGSPPGPVRGALLAACKTAAELGLGMDELIAALEPKEPPPPRAAPKSGKAG